MFPRIKKCVKKSGVYEYLVLSESIRDSHGRSTTRDVSNLGNISRFDKKAITHLIDGLIRLFEIEEFGLADQVEILQSLDYGSIILWRHFWKRLKLGKIISESIQKVESRVSIDASKYAEMMVVNRCINPLSKLATSRWMTTTCYTKMEGYSDLPDDVQYFYRSMDYLLKAKDDIEYELFKCLRNLFSINVRITFYDITSTFFHTDSCPLALNGLSRDKRPDKKQIVIGVVTSYEGYPLKHYVFEGNTKDECTVGEVIRSLKKDFHIEETTFVGDRGMITRLNLERIESEEFDYIMGVKHRQNEMMPMLLEDAELFTAKAKEWNGLKVSDRRVSIKSFLVWKTARILKLPSETKDTDAWQSVKQFIEGLAHDNPIENSRVRELLNNLGYHDSSLSRKIIALLKKYHDRCEETDRIVCALNEDRAIHANETRREKIASLSQQLDKVLACSKTDKLEQKIAAVFEGYNRRYRKFFDLKQTHNPKDSRKYRIKEEAITADKKHDGVFMLTTTRMDLSPEKVVEAYKHLQEVETLFDDLKHFVDIHPVRHRLEMRVRAHVFLCILALLLKRVFEIDCLGNKCITNPLETVAKSKLVNYKVRLSERSSACKMFWKVTTVTPEQHQCFTLAGIKNPENLQDFMWWRN